MRNFLRLIFALFLIGTAGCATTRSIPTQENSYEGMEIYSSKIPDKPFQEISFIEVSGGWPTGPKALMNRMVKRARKEGANGIVNVRLISWEKHFTVSGTSVNFDHSN
jgi:hypothetical protein